MTFVSGEACHMEWVRISARSWCAISHRL